jgi:NtrC-family two-component system response regulator AlgB
LRNAIERAVILAQGDEVTPKDLPIDVTKGGGSEFGADAAVRVGARLSLEDLEREHIHRIVSSTESLSDAAEILGIDQATLYRKRKKMGIE